MKKLSEIAKQIIKEENETPTNNNRVYAVIFYDNNDHEQVIYVKGVYNKIEAKNIAKKKTKLKFSKVTSEYLEDYDNLDDGEKEQFNGTNIAVFDPEPIE